MSMMVDYLHGLTNSEFVGNCVVILSVTSVDGAAVVVGVIIYNNQLVGDTMMDHTRDYL